MASGRLGAANPAADTDTTVYTVPGSTVASLNVAIVNMGTGDAVVSVAISSSGTPAASEYVERNVTLIGNGVLERTAIVAAAGEMVVVNCSTNDCAIRVHGYEEAE